ncbi:putative ferric-chelate reductase 1 [Gordionus sp. m RMFG-2023]|uniref:putative ferric-chelate reductase 1 n=1 Tax=Gordionus sp. m RMFG-2023 TaxID=3053472 RepID=UPI0031FCA531
MIKFNILLSIFICVNAQQDIVTPKPPDLSHLVPPIKVYPECGTSKSCFRSPAGCLSEDECDRILTYKPSNSYHHNEVDFELMSKVDSNNAWAGTAFSKTNTLSDSSLVLCVYNSMTGQVEVANYYNPPDAEITEKLPNSEKDGLRNMSGTLLPDRIRCRFSKGVEGSTKDSRVFPLAGNKYHLGMLWGKALHGTPFRHTSEPLMTAEALPLTVESAHEYIYPRVPIVYKLHTILFLIAWVGFISFAIIISRYFRTMWPGKYYFGEPIWFGWHRICYVLAICCLIPAFILVFIYLLNWTQNQFDFPRGTLALGIIATLLAMCIPILSLFRCNPNSKSRPIYNWIVWIVETIALLLAQIYIFLLFSLPKMVGTRRFHIDWIMIAFIIVFVITELILEIHACCITDKDQRTSPLVELPPHKYYARNPKGSAFKMAVLTFYTIISTILLLAMIILIAVA